MRNPCPTVQNHRLHPFAVLGYSADVVATSTTSREKLNNLLVANSSTPFNYRAFFVRSFRLPKINPAMDLFSMVERNRHAFSVAAYPLGAVSHPVTFYRQTVRSLAVVPSTLTSGATYA